MSVKYSYQPPLCEAVCCETKYSLLTGGSPVATAMTISLIEFGDDVIGDDGDL